MTKKSHGPIQVPCGIPAGTGVNSEKQSEQSLTRWDLSRKKFATQLTTMGLTPRLYSLATSKLWFTRSKAFL